MKYSGHITVAFFTVHILSTWGRLLMSSQPMGSVLARGDSLQDDRSQICTDRKTKRERMSDIYVTCMLISTTAMWIVFVF